MTAAIADQLEQFPHCATFRGTSNDAVIELGFGILLIADEVITGYGRTGSWTGSRHCGVKPDFAVTAKAITNGHFPFGAVMIADHVAEVFETDATGAAVVASGQACSGHPVGAAARG